MYTSLNTVQTFVRTLSFIVTFLGLSTISILPLASSFGENPATTLIFLVLFGINLWISIIVSGIFYVLPEWERLVLLRLGKYSGIKGPGFFVIPPFIFSAASIVDIRIMTQQVEATATLTQDNVPTKVTAALEYQVEDAQKAVVNVKDYLSTVIWMSTEALKNTIGSLELKELLSNRDEIAKQLREQIDSQAAGYGINVLAVRITDIDTPKELIEELAVIARANRTAQAKRIQAQAELEVAELTSEASKILEQSPYGMQLRELQNLAEMSKESSNMIIVYPYGDPKATQIANAAVAQHRINSDDVNNAVSYPNS